MQKIFKRLIFIAVAAILSVGISGCHKDEDTTKKTHRTILVYMAACNSLGSADADDNDIAEMLTAVKNGDLNGGRLLLYHADVNANVKLYDVTVDGLVELHDYSNDGLSSVKAERMLNVIADAKRIAPAEEYGLILWSHGSGWLQDGLDESATTATTQSKSQKSFGLERNTRMNITTLANVLNGQGFAFVYFDCCYMGSIEVAYELRDTTPYIVASVSELPVDGMPYDKNLKCLFADNFDLVGAATNTFNFYNDQSGFWQTCTMSVIRTAGLGNLAAATRYIYEKAETCYPTGYKPQPFMADATCYYYDLGDYVKALASDEDYASWQTALNNCLLYTAATPTLWQQVLIDSHSGFSTYIFKSEDDAVAARKNYDTLSWYTDVVSALFNKTDNQ